MPGPRGNRLARNYPVGAAVSYETNVGSSEIVWHTRWGGDYQLARGPEAYIIHIRLSQTRMLLGAAHDKYHLL